MGKLVKIIGSDVYIYAERKSLHRLETWYLKEVSNNPNFDNDFTIDYPFLDYPNIWRVRGHISYNVKRMASQIGSALVYNQTNNKLLSVENKI